MMPRMNLAWGAGYFDRRYSPNLRLGAIEKEYTDGPFVTAFVEHKSVAGFRCGLCVPQPREYEDGFNPDGVCRPARRAGRVQRAGKLRKFGRFFQLTVTEDALASPRRTGFQQVRFYAR